MQMFFDLEANKQMLQSYTKEVAAVVIFGRSNAKFNISTLANAYVPQEVLDEYAKAKPARQKELKHKWSENAGLLVDEAGNITGINFSEEHSVSPAFAQQIFHDEARNKDCGAIMVGASVNHAIYSAAQAWIRMVIPFHLSGMPKAAQDKTDVKWYFDNTPFQSTRKKTKEGWSKIESSEDTFKFYNDMNAPGWNMRDKAKEYLAWCQEKGFRPKFDWGINSDYYRAYCEEQGYEPNQQIIDIMDADTTDGVWNQYYKFLTDFTAYKPVFNEQGEMIDEIPSPQMPVVSNFDFSEMERDVLFEGEKKILKALDGADEMSKYVDALLVINNERLTDIYRDLDFINAFGKADETLSTAARSISELITCNGHINLDFNDVDTTLRNGGAAIISSGYGEGENRVTKAINDALNSPLLKNQDIFGSKKLLFNLYFSREAEHKFVMDEAQELTDFISNLDSGVDVIWGVAFDESLGDKIKITILASGFDNPIRNIETKAKPTAKTLFPSKPDTPQELNRMQEIYGSEKINEIQNVKDRARYVILQPGQMDDDSVVEKLEKTPAFNRDKKVADEIKSGVKKVVVADEDAQPESNNQSSPDNRISINFGDE
jgi:hypothetical protein